MSTQQDPTCFTRPGSIVLTDGQCAAVGSCVDGFNTFITGGAQTGKLAVLLTILHRMRELRPTRTVAVLAPDDRTVHLLRHYGEHAATVDRFFGLSPATHTDNVEDTVVLANNAMSKRWKHHPALAPASFTMVLFRVFELDLPRLVTMEGVLRSNGNHARLFGGAQVVFIGDPCHGRVGEHAGLGASMLFAPSLQRIHVLTQRHVEVTPALDTALEYARGSRGGIADAGDDAPGMPNDIIESLASADVHDPACECYVRVTSTDVDRVSANTAHERALRGGASVEWQLSTGHTQSDSHALVRELVRREAQLVAHVHSNVPPREVHRNMRVRLSPTLGGQYGVVLSATRAPTPHCFGDDVRAHAIERGAAVLATSTSVHMVVVAEACPKARVSGRGFVVPAVVLPNSLPPFILPTILNNRATKLHTGDTPEVVRRRMDVRHPEFPRAWVASTGLEIAEAVQVDDLRAGGVCAMNIDDGVVGHGMGFTALCRASSEDTVIISGRPPTRPEWAQLLGVPPHARVFVARLHAAAPSIVASGVRIPFTVATRTDGAFELRQLQASMPGLHAAAITCFPIAVAGGGDLKPHPRGALESRQHDRPKRTRIDDGTVS